MAKCKLMKPSNKIFIYGRHAVAEALKNSPQVITSIYLDPNRRDGQLEKLAKSAGLKVSTLKTNDQFAKSQPGHQGAMAKVSLDRLMKPYDDFIKTLDVNPDTSLLILDEVQDPHNVGAAIRSAAAFGVSAVLIPKHNQSPVTGAVVKVSAGTAFQIPLVQIGNVNNTVRDLKEKGFWIYGLDSEGKQKLDNEEFEKPSVLILGNEATGIRQKTKEMCDIILSIPMDPRCESLNAAASSAVALYAWRIKQKDLK